MFNWNSSVAGIALCLLSSALLAQSSTTVGDDVFVSDSNASQMASAPRDIFVAGFAVAIHGNTAEDAHVAGFDVSVMGPVGADLYAAGANVMVSSAVGDDASISGFTVKLLETGTIGGNARLAAGTLLVDAPIDGSVAASAGTIKLNARIGGDAVLSAADIEFGPNARVEGNLRYSAPNPVNVPTSVAPTERVNYVPLSHAGVLDDVRETIDKSIPSFWPSLFSTVIGVLLFLAFLLIIASLFLAFMPERIAHLRKRAKNNSGRALMMGFIGLATLFGLIPVAAITIVGLPLIPAVLLALIIFWVLGYLLGAHLLSLKLSKAFFALPASLGSMLAALAVALAGLALLNFIPIVGWLLNVGVMLFGLGVISMAVGARLLGVDRKSDNYLKKSTGLASG